MTKYKEYVKNMLDKNKSIFENFKKVHDKYALDQDASQEEFNKVGKEILTIVQDTENKLCLQSEKAGYGNYTKNLSEKFREELKKIFPMFDYIGIIVKPPRNFSFKRIKLY